MATGYAAGLCAMGVRVRIGEALGLKEGNPIRAAARCSEQRSLAIGRSLRDRRADPQQAVAARLMGSVAALRGRHGST